MNIRLSSMCHIPFARKQRRLIKWQWLLISFIVLTMLFFGFNEAVLAATITLVREPYVQQVGPNSLIVVWTTTEAGASEVHYGTTDYGATAVATSTYFTTADSAPYDAYYVHEATLTSLSPDTLYQYKIFTGGEDITPGGSITARSGKPSNATAFRFAAFGDSGQGNQAQDDVAARLLQIQPDFVVHTGDVVYGGAKYKNYETRYFQVYADLIKSVWLAPSAGNHDTDFNDGQSFVDVFMNPPNGAADPIEREMYYSFDYANAHFTVLTSELPYKSGTAQYQWLENDLANSNQYWKFVVFHVPPYYSSDTQEFRKNGQVASNLPPLFEQYDVDVVFSGDIHFYERMLPLKDDAVATIAEDGVVYVVTGGGGAGLRNTGNPPWSDYTGGKAKLYHLTMLDVSGCQLELSGVVRSEGGDAFDNSDIFDSYTLDRCTGAPVADFSADNTDGNAPFTVNFSDLSTRDPSSWTWDFGDGQQSTDRHPSHIYDTAGTYSVSLTVSNSLGNDVLTKSNYITVAAAPASLAYFTQTAYEVDEFGGPTVTMTVALTQPSATAITVDYSTGDVTAVAPGDYISKSGVLTFAPQEISKTFAVTIVDDALAEPTEQLQLTLSGASVMAPSTATITILDDDTPPVIRFSQEEFNAAEDDSSVEVLVELSYAFHTAITVDYTTSNGSATAGEDYASVAETLTFAPGETNKTILIPLLDDTADEFNEAFMVNLSNPTVAPLSSPTMATVTVSDNDLQPDIAFAPESLSIGEGSNRATLTVKLSAISGKTVTVDYVSADATAVAGLDYTAVTGSLTFLPGETSKMISVPIVDDDLDEPNETAVVHLQNGMNGIVGNPLLLTIEDDEAPPQLNFELADYVVVENNQTVEITVELSTVSGQSVMVDYGVSGGTAVAGNDYQALGGTLTFAAGESHKTFVITTIDDLLNEGSETVIVALSNPELGTLGGTVNTTVTIIDDDAPPPTVGFEPNNLAFVEDGHMAMIAVQLSAATNKVVTVNYATQDGTAVAGTDYTAVDDTLTFAPGETSKFILVPLLSDDIRELSETILLLLTNPNNADLGPNDQVVLSILDSDSFTIFMPLIQRS